MLFLGQGVGSAAGGAAAAILGPILAAAGPLVLPLALGGAAVAYLVHEDAKEKRAQAK